MDPTIALEIETAERQIGAAENALHAALQSVVSAPRAEKTTINEAVQAALDRLSAARVALAELHDPPADDSPADET